jgi:hypothetical protein
MRLLPLLLLALACAPTEPPQGLNGTWTGTYRGAQAVVRLQHHDSTVVGTLSVTGGSRTGTIQGVVRDADLAVNLTYTDGCGGKATGSWAISLNDFQLDGDLSITDCNGSYTGVVSLRKAPTSF